MDFFFFDYTFSFLFSFTEGFENKKAFSELIFIDSFFFDYFPSDFCDFNFPTTTPFKDFLAFLNTFFFSTFIDLDYAQPFSFREIPLKDFYFKEFKCRDYDLVYQEKRSVDYFFSC